MECTLEHEMESVTRAARSILMENGKILPTLHVFGSRGGEEIVAIVTIGCELGTSATEQVESFRVLGAQLQGAVGQLAFVIHVQEADIRWADEHGQPDDRTKAEVVTILGTDPNGKREHRVLRVERDELGALTGLTLLPAPSLGRIHLDADMDSAFIEGYQAASPEEVTQDTHLVALQIGEDGKILGPVSAAKEREDEGFTDFE